MTDIGYRSAAEGKARSCAFCKVALDPQSAGLSRSGEYACPQCLASEQIRISSARAQTAFAPQPSGGGFSVFAGVLMVALPLAGAYIGSTAPTPSGDYGGGLVSLVHTAIGFLAGGVCSIALFVQQRRSVRQRRG